jgi:tetratricopeptide (TPR) repeat protein
MLASCSTLKPAGKAKDSNQILTEKKEQEFRFSLIEASKHKMLGDYLNSLSLYLRCLEIKPNSALANYEIANIHVYQQDFSGAQKYAEFAVEKNPSNIWYQLLLGHIYLNNNEITKAIDIYKNLIKTNPEETDYYIDLAIIYSKIGKTKKAIEILNKIEEKNGISEQISLQKETIYFMDGKFEKAIDEIEKLVELYPKETKYLGQIAELHIADKNYYEAFEIFKKIFEIDPYYSIAHLSLADLYRLKKDYENWFKELELAFKSENLNVMAKVTSLLYFLSESNEFANSDKKYTLLNILLETHQNNAVVHSVYADFLVSEKDFEQALKEYRTVLSIDKKSYLIWEQTLLIESQLANYDTMYIDSKEALEYFPNQPLIYLFNGIAAKEIKKYEEAKKVLEMGLDLVADSKQLKVQFYLYLGEIFHIFKENKKSDEYFDKLLEIDGNNILVLNNYSYYLSLREEFLEKAEQMSRQTIEAEPNNATYLDTYAWILFKMANFEKALEIIEKAILNSGDKSAVIIEHYGDILYKNGQKDKAKQQWKNAVETGKGSELLQKKMEEGIFIE